MTKRNRHQRGINLPNTQDLNREFAKQSAIEIWHFVKRNAPLAKRNTLDGRMFYIDSEQLVNTLVLTGRRLYANEVRGFRAPVNQRVPVQKHTTFIYDSIFRQIDTATKFGQPGVYIHDVEYYGGEKLQKGYFGIKRGGEVRAYGISNTGTALPAYSIALPEWVVEEQAVEINRILSETFERVFKKKLEAA